VAAKSDGEEVRSEKREEERLRLEEVERVRRGAVFITMGL